VNGRPARKPRGVVAGCAAVVIVAAGVFAALKLFGQAGDPGDASRRRVAIDSITGEVFENHRIRDEDSQPWKHPRTGERTLYAAERCFWMRDGGVKAEPSYVLLNGYAGKEGPTLCPDCGRVVTARNPLPPLELLAAAARARKAAGR